MFRTIVVFFGILVTVQVVTAQRSADAMAAAKWEKLLLVPLNEVNFRAACTLIGEVGRQDAVRAMAWTDQLIDSIRTTGHRRWMHALLTNKYVLAQTVYAFRDSAAVLASRIQANAGQIRDPVYREAIVYRVHADVNTGQLDPASSYLDSGIRACQEAGDSLNLAMLHALKGELLFKKKTAPEDALEALGTAQQLSGDLPNKTPYFIASYLAAHISHMHNPSQLVEALEQLVPLSKDPSLIKRAFDAQTFLPFSKPTLTIYLDLMRINLVLMDYTSARRMHQLIEGYLLSLARDQGGVSQRSMGMLVADRAVIEAFAGDRALTGKLLDSCRAYFAGIPEDDIASVNFFLARTLLDEMDGRYGDMLQSVQLLQSTYTGGAVLPLSLTTLIAHAHARNGNTGLARFYFEKATAELEPVQYSAAGYYHYQRYAAWLLDQGDYRAYAAALNNFYSIKDSIADIQHLRHMRDVEARHYVKERDTEIAYLKKIQEAEGSMHRSVLYGGLLVSVSLLLTVAILYSRYRQNRKNNTLLMEKNARIETLIRELHHRVKNNLQVISGLLSLQSMRMETGAAKEAVTEGQRRVEAMALIHQKLYQYNDITGVDMRAYVQELVAHLMDSHGAPTVKTTLEIDEVLLDIDTAVPLGLIINELVTNSLKYGVGAAKNGRIYIRISQSEVGYQLTLADNGPGLPEGFSIERSPSFGLKLVASLVRQLRATIKWQNKPGTQFDLTIPTLSTQ